MVVSYLKFFFSKRKELVLDLFQSSTGTVARDAGVFEAEEQRLIPGQPVRRSGSPGGGGGKFSGSSSEFDCRVFQPGTGPTLFHTVVTARPHRGRSLRCTN